MIIGQFHISRIPGFPAKANPVLVINPNAVLPRPVSLQRLKPVAWAELAGRRASLPDAATEASARPPAQSPPNDAMPPGGTTTPCHGHGTIESQEAIIRWL